MAEAISTWALLDVSNQTLIKANDFQRDFPMDDLIDASRLPARVHIPPKIDAEFCGTRRIVYSDIDFNGHMNNTKYPDMVCDFLPDIRGRWVKNISLSYLKEATYGSAVDVYRSKVILPAECSDREEAYFVRTVRPDGATAFEAYIHLSENEK